QTNNKKYEKKTTVQQTEPEASEPLNDLPTSSKKPRKPHRAKDKENVNPNDEETTIRLPATSNQLQEDLQSEQYAYQQNCTSSRIQNRTTSSLAAAKYQHRVPSQINMRSGVSRVQSNGPETDSFPQHLSSSGEHLSDYEDELSEDESSEDKIFSSLNRYNSTSSNIQNTNPYTTIQQNRDYTTSAQNNEISFQDKAHLLRWLETRKDLVLQALHAICSSLPVMSNQ
ncbi:41983_t:CDS:2, partial [Gigaspora margarita]